MEPHPHPVIELQDDQLVERLKLLVELLAPEFEQGWLPHESSGCAMTV